MSAEPDLILLGATAMLGSAFLHAFMGLLTKKSGDTLVFRAAMMAAGALIFSPLLIFSPFPDWEVWRFLLTGAVLHWAFQMAMIAAFDRADMGLVYPVMRGAAPALAGLAAFAILGETLSPMAMLGLAAASAAVLGFSWPEKNGAPKLKALGFALIASVMTGLYAVNDASGARAAGSALDYLPWFFIASTPLIVLTALIRRGGRFLVLARAEMRSAGIASVFGGLSYLLALTAFTLAPVAPMAAMRETAVVFGAVLAALVLKEPFGRKRILLAIGLALGLVLMQIS